MSLRTVSLLLLVVAGLANDAAPSKPDAAASGAPAQPADETSWSNFVYCKCGLTCVKQMGSWYIFDLGQSCGCEACPEETADATDATGHLRGSQETQPKDAPKEETTEPKVQKPEEPKVQKPEEPKVQTPEEPKAQKPEEPQAEQPEAVAHTKDAESTETKLSLKSLNSAPVASSTENEDKWEGANVRGSNMLYCKCGKKCAYGRQLGLYTFYCFRYGCNAC